MVIAELINKSNKILQEAGIKGFNLDTFILLSEFLGVDKMYLLLNKNVEVTNYSGFFEMVARRAKFEPIAYITCKREFMSLEFDVTPDVLIPRPETELLVEKIIEFTGNKQYSMLEVGTGSGCICISCAYYCKNLHIDSIDISQQALDVARQNARKHKIESISFIQKDILKSFPSQQYDIVVSNPPYIKSYDIAKLMCDVKNFEPISALDGGEDGLLFYRIITKQANVKRMLLFEVGHDQSDAVCSILLENAYNTIETIKDLSGINRVVYGAR
ncbi:MAG: peptide chain release factor N(5)-glutamine methyltransferase [Clostridiaceae bacterium]|nr:peptide chain release factor N(5)-glutamine methyltransferase [Clostridiaceae bacterium]